MFQGIRKLPPGTIARVRGGRLEIEPYWELRFEDAPDDAAPLARRVRETLRDSVHAWMMSDVPEGVFLSGGLDSTAVLAFTREATTGPLPTFTLGYDDPSFSEWEYAREAARYYGTEHREIRVPPVTPDVIEQTVWHLDEPMTDLSAVPLFLLCREARRDVTVCMSGRGRRRGLHRLRPVHRVEGGPPLPDAAARPPARGHRAPGHPAARSGAEEGAGRRPAPVHRGRPSRPRRASHALAVLRLDALDAPLPGYRAPLGRPGPLRADPPGVRPLQLARQLDREIFVDTRFTMPDSVLMKVDKMSMAHALEIRVPLLDHHLIELAASIPPRLKFPGFRTRAIYRQALEGVLPPKILHRGKQGYSLPLKQWLRNELRDYMVQLLRGSEVVRAHLDPGGRRGADRRAPRPPREPQPHPLGPHQPDPVAPSVH